MKLFSTLIFLLFYISFSYAQKTSTVIIESNKELSKGYYLNIQNKNYGFDPEKTKHELTLSLEHPEFGFIISGKGKKHIFWYEEGQIKINLKQGLLKDELIVKGSDSQRIYETLKEATDFKEFRSVFESNRNSIVALNYIDGYFKSLSFSTAEFKEIDEFIAPKNRSLTPRFNSYMAVIDKAKLKKNSKFIDFVGIDKDGNAFNTADFRGQFLLIDVAATWCGPCWGAFPYMIQFLKENENIRFLTLNEDSDIEKWESRRNKKDLNIDWPVLWEVKSGKEDLLNQFEIEGYPTYILVDPKGIVVERWDFSNEIVFNSKLKKHLN